MATRPSSIIDPTTNKPFLIETFDQEIGGPTVGGARRHPDSDLMRGITPRRLATIIREAKDGSPQAMFELAEEMEERDAHYTSVLGTRKRAVAQLAVKVEAASASAKDVEIADAFRKWTRRRRLQAEIFDLLDAIGKGISVMEIIWDKSQPIWMPARLVLRPMSWFLFDHVERETPRLRTDQNPLGDELAPGKWIVHRHPAKSGLSIRSGIAIIIAWTVVFSRFTEADWMAFADTYGQPFRIGKYPPGTEETARRLLHHAVMAMGADAAATIPSSMTVDFVQGAKSDGAMFGALASYFNRMKSKLVLGQETTTEAIAGGHAVSQEQNEVRGDIRDADAVLVSDSLQEQLVGPWTAVNYGPEVDPPILSLDYEAPEDIKAVTDVAFGIADRGGRVQVKQLRDKVGLVEPEDGDEILGAAATPRTTPPDSVPASADPAMNARRLRSRLFARQVPRQQIRTALNTAVQAKNEAEIVDQLEAMLEEAGQPPIDGWIDQLKGVLSAANSLEDLAVKFLELYPELDVDVLTDVMGQALALANISGRDLDP